jgi:hypothetical protein
MSTPASPAVVYEPPTCSSSFVGPCAKCQRPTHKYGPDAKGPLCNECMAEARALWPVRLHGSHP